MTNRDVSVRASRSYEVAFQVGAVGSIVLGLAAVLGDLLAGLAALAVWCLVTLFVLPWLYILYLDKVPHFPSWLTKGPHQ
jgi:hypothetical protein